MLNCCFNTFYFNACVASPASGKLGMRMTTLHEEPGNISNTNGRRNGRDGDKEDSHSDPENDSVNVQVMMLI